LEVLGWVLVALLCCGAAVGWQMYRYPGGWAYAYGAMHAPDRKELAAARMRVRRIRREEGRERSSADAELRDAERRQRRLIKKADSRIEELRNPGPGQEYETQGAMALFQRSLRVADETIPLDGLTVRFEAGRRKICYIHVTLPDGHERSASFPADRFEEEDIRRFSRRIVNVAADENKASAERDEQIAEIEKERRRAMADTAAQEAAKEKIAQLAEHHRKQGRLAAAVEELAHALDRWQGLTGHRPSR
jgi:hypothetical protein